MNILINELSRMIETACALGLSEKDLMNAKEYLKHNELELCFDTVITQLYEYEIEINEQFYELVSKIAKSMKLQQESYFFIKDLINYHGSK